MHSFADSWIVKLNTSAVNSIMQQYGGYVQQVVNSSGGIYRIWLPSGSLGTLLAKAIQTNPLVKSIEPDSVVTLPQTTASSSSTARYTAAPLNLVALPQTCTNFTIPGGSHGTPAAGSAYALYLHQTSNCLIEINKGQSAYGVTGQGVTVAVIDTGVDFTNPYLDGKVVLPGPSAFAYGSQDFTGNNDPGGTIAQETSPMVDQETSPMVDQETSPMVDSAGTFLLNQETSPMVDQETSPMVDSHGNKLPPALGHGTMVAGIIHLVAPGSPILSLKAFTNDGFAATSSLLAAIYYAANQPAVHVINASWSTTGSSNLLNDAVAYAISKGKIVVAAVANNGSLQPVYPAAYPNVIGVGCTDDTDARCTFSNFGSDVNLAAPGFGITSTFPMAYSKSGFATGSGTSFSTPYVAGTVALIQAKGNPNSAQTTNDLTKGGAKLPSSLNLGGARLDVYGALGQVK